MEQGTENRLYPDWALQLRRFKSYFRTEDLESKEMQQMKRECEEIVSVIQANTLPQYTQSYLIGYSDLYSFNESFRKSKATDILDYTERFMEENFNEHLKLDFPLNEEQRERLIKIGKIGVNPNYIPYQLNKANQLLSEFKLSPHIRRTESFPIMIYSKKLVPVSMYQYLERNREQYVNFLKYLWDKNIQEFPGEDIKEVANQWNGFCEDKGIEAHASFINIPYKRPFIAYGFSDQPESYKVEIFDRAMLKPEFKNFSNWISENIEDENKDQIDTLEKLNQALYKYYECDDCHGFAEVFETESEAKEYIEKTEEAQGIGRQEDEWEEEWER